MAHGVRGDLFTMHKLMIVDDNIVLRKILGVTFRYSNFKLIFAENGEHAMEMAVRELPSIFILDVKMPGIDGFEVCRRIRSNPRLQDSIVVILTSLDDENARDEGMRSGADYFMTKPFHSIELVEVVEELYAKKKLADKQNLE